MFYGKPVTVCIGRFGKLYSSLLLLNSLLENMINGFGI